MNLSPSAPTEQPPELRLSDPPEGPPRVRSPVDVLRAIVGGILVIGGLGHAFGFDSTLLGFAEDANEATGDFPDWSRDLAPSALGSVVIAGALLLVVWSLMTTRYRRFVSYAAGIAAAAGLSMLLGRVLDGLVDDAVRRSFDVEIPVFRVAGPDGRMNPADPLLAASIATLTIASSFLPTRFIRRAAVVVAVYALTSSLMSTAAPLALPSDVGAGLLVGSLLLVIVGRHDVALRPHEIAAALASAGCDVIALEPRPGAERNEWLATRSSGEHLIVHGLSRDDRSSALIVRLVRWLRLRKTGDHRPFLTLRRNVEHRALVALEAGVHGIETPPVRAVAPAGVDGMVLARDPIPGEVVGAGERANERRAQHGVPVDVLRAAWRQVARLQRARIAHGRLRLDSFAIDESGRPWLVGFERGELVATDQRLGTDIAELLASSAEVVGVDQAVAIAHDEIGGAMLQRAVPWLQPLALTAQTRDSISTDELDELRVATASTCGLDPEPPVRLERIDAKTVFVLGTIVLSGWFLLPQLADLDALWSQARDAAWNWALIAVVCSVVTYVAATASLLGAIPVRLAYWPALTAQVASSFANRVTPAKVGGFATNLRYFQRKGVPLAVGATAVGLNAVAGVIMHAVLTLCALLLASGDAQADGLSMPSVGVVLLCLGAIAMTA
ncbi:MAG: lysylphosphatidylglycerol synthase domain-containing protein, partial [Actinomycetota bacterium]